jgi:hypothetical protein
MRLSIRTAFSRTRNMAKLSSPESRIYGSSTPLPALQHLLLWALPFPQSGAGGAPAVRWGLRGGVFAAMAVMILILALEAMRVHS